MHSRIDVIGDTKVLTTSQSLAFIAAGVISLFAIWRASWFVLGGTLRLGRHGLRRTKNTPLHGSARRISGQVARSWPRLHGFLTRRLAADHMTGLPLTLLGLAALYVGLLFGGLVEKLAEAQEIQAIDGFAFSLLSSLRSREIVAVFLWITDLGSIATLAVASLVATGFMWAHGPRYSIAPVWLSVAGSQLTTWGGKVLIARPRPEFILDVSAYSPSFPSGHAAGAMAVYGIIAYVIVRDLESPKMRFDIAYWTGVIILLVGFSRLLLNLHYVSDVAAGILVGGFWVLVGIATGEMIRAANGASIKL